MQNKIKESATHTSYSYDHNCDLGTTEFNATISGDYQYLSIPGTNEKEDWVKNGNLWSKKGIKKSAYAAAIEINEVFKRQKGLILIVNGHSKGAAEAVAYTRLFGADFCNIFNPARMLRYWADRKMDNTTMFIDPDDPVSKIGFISFGLPICKTYKAENDHILPSISDHNVGNWLGYIDKKGL